MRILGLDPGLQHSGWAIIEHMGAEIRALGSDRISTNADTPLALRLAQLHESANALIERFAPQEAAIEKVFVNRDAHSSLKLGHARAAIMLAPALKDMPIAEYAPNSVKKTVAGVGHADKAQIEYMIRLQIKDANPQSADASDAFAIALCHLFHRPALDGPALDGSNRGKVA